MWSNVYDEVTDFEVYGFKFVKSKYLENKKLLFLKIEKYYSLYLKRLHYGKNSFLAKVTFSNYLPTICLKANSHPPKGFCGMTSLTFSTVIK